MFQPRFLCLMCGIALAIACTDPSDSTAPSQARSFNVLPSNNHATVNRFTAWYAAILVDEHRHLTLVAGVPFEQLASVCQEGTGLFTFDPATIHTVLRPDGSLADHWHGKDVSLVIFEGEFQAISAQGFSARHHSSLELLRRCSTTMILT